MSLPRIKVLVWYWGRRGGGPRHCLEVTKSLMLERDLDVSVSLSRQSEFYAAFEKLGLKGFPVDTYGDLRSAALASLRLPAMRRRFLQYLRDEKIDIVYCPMSHVWNWLIVGGIRELNIPYLLTLHDLEPHKGENFLVRRALMNREISHAGGIIALSDWVAQGLADSGYGGHIWTIPHGPFYYDTGDDSPRSFPEGRPFRLLFFGRILPYKGLHLLLDALEMLRKTFPETELHIAGSGSIRAYQDRINRMGGIRIDNRWIDENEVPDIIRAADLVVLPYTEASQSGVIAGCQGLGVPVVATPVGGLAEQLHQTKAGIVCEDVSAGALERAIKRLLASKIEYEELVRAIPGKESQAAWINIGQKTAQAIRSLCPHK